MSTLNTYLKIGDFFKIGEAVLYRLPRGNYYSVTEICDWESIKTYTIRRCSPDGKSFAIAKNSIVWAELIDQQIESGKIIRC